MITLVRFASSLAVAIGVALLIAPRQSANAEPCPFGVDVPTLTFGDGQTGFPVQATSTVACSWSAESSAPWLRAIASQFGPSTTFFFTALADANTTGAVRQAIISVNGRAVVSVTQGTEPCVSGFNPPSITTTAAGAPRTAQLLTTVPDCAWMVGNFAAWVAFPSPLSGRGPAIIGFNFIPNISGPARSTDMPFGGRTIHIEQLGPTCLFTTTPARVDLPANGGSGTFEVTGVGTDCNYTARPQGDNITITGGATGTAPATVSYTVKPNLSPDNTWRIQVENATFEIHQNGPPVRTDQTTTLQFSAALGSPGGPGVRLSSRPLQLRLTNSEQPAADYTASADKPWLVLTPATGHTPAQLTLALDPIQVAMLSPGFYNSLVTITSSIAPVSKSFASVFLRVYGPTETWSPIGVFETPKNNTTVAGAIPVTGWAVDPFGIARIALYRDPVAGEPAGLVFIGDAIRVRGARPDVARFTTSPEIDLAGWGYMLLTNVLPGGGNGTFTLHAFVDNTDGTRVLLGSRTVTVDNQSAIKPFGTIDEPAQGETVSGTLLNRGWVLTPLTKTIPFDGSTINVYIDGALRAPVTSYNNPRPDVKAFFSGLSNSDGPQATLSIDTTTLANGVHTIAWGVTDSAGVAEGIGSRYFTVDNGTSALVDEPIDTSRSTASVARMPLLRSDVWSREGMDDAGWATRVETDAKGKRTVQATQGQRIELFLDPTLQAACGTYEGHLLTGDVASPLPAGASLDAQRGIFRWQPSPAFSGAFEFTFVQRGCDGIERRVPLRVVINP
jgi:hypothetical protein